jgi:hypothetical protein
MMRRSSGTLWHLSFTALLGAVTLAAVACSSLPIGTTAEPPVIVVRNHSNVDIDTVTLRETTGSSNQAARFGSISPVPSGVSQAYIRPANPPRFPKTVTLEWIDRESKTHSRDLSITKALRSATGATDEALVFEIWPNEEVLVFVEQAGHRGPRK